jgi:hypothetical protein
MLSANTSDMSTLAVAAPGGKAASGWPHRAHAHNPGRTPVTRLRLATAPRLARAAPVPTWGCLPWRARGVSARGQSGRRLRVACCHSHLAPHASAASQAQRTQQNNAGTRVTAREETKGAGGTASHADGRTGVRLRVHAGTRCMHAMQRVQVHAGRVSVGATCAPHALPAASPAAALPLRAALHVKS